MSSADNDDDVIEVEVDEVVSPKQTANGRIGQNLPGEPRSPIAKMLSYVLDESIAVPGTRFRFGLDPVIGLIPIGGEAMASIAGAFIIGEAYRKGVSLRTVFRMAGNMLTNATIGAIPGLGDLFSAFFKSNKRNYHILDDFLKNPPPTGKRRPLWPLLLALVTTCVAINATMFFLVVWLIKSIGDLAF